MKNKSLSLTLILAALTLGMVASCGGDDAHEVAGAGGVGAGSGGSGASSGSGGASGTSGSGGSGGINTGGASGGGAGGASGGGAGGDGGDGGGGGFGNNQQMCPPAQPTNGGTCTSGRGDCEFGDNICDCLNDTDTWVCWNPATDCPATAPISESPCPMVGIECGYGQGQNGNECDCEEEGWQCDEEPGGDADGGV
jgi:hypothetical protein